MDRDALFCVVDKAAGEGHSFVDGMLRGCIRSRRGIVPIVFSRGNGGACADGVIQAPFRRRGLGRVGYAFYALYAYLGEFGFSAQCRVFIRNDILCLCVFLLYRQVCLRTFDVVFQTSFPHENFSSNSVSRWVGRRILAYAIPKCLRVLVVNEGAIPRIRKYSEDVEICVVPLCCDFELSGVAEEDVKRGPISFVYVGTFDPLRQLDIVLQAFASVAARRNFVVDLIGGGREQLCADEATTAAIDLLQKRNMLNFWPKLPRSEVRVKIAGADVGVNLIPPLDVYKESSSTKLGEYLSQGIPVISSSGIPYHHQIHGFGDVGWLVDFDTMSIGYAIERAIDLGRDRLANYREACLKVVDERLRYEAYVDAVIS